MSNEYPGKLWAVLMALFLVAGCAAIDFDYPRTESRALGETDQTYLGRLLAEKNGGADGIRTRPALKHTDATCSGINNLAPHLSA